MEEARGVLAEKLVALLHLMLLLLLLAPCTIAQNQVSSSERLALLNLRSSLGLKSNKWPIKTQPCGGWAGIDCWNGHIVGINISGFMRTRAGRLRPSFSVDSLSNLTFLESFNASRFLLPGSIPEWFGSRLGSLQVLDLRSCSVSGFVPGSLGNLTRLSALYLSDNELAGSIPDTFGGLKQLKVLDASSNVFTGPIPTSLASLVNLSRLDLSSNYLSGSIPSELGGLQSLELMNLSDNGLSGSIPVELGNLSRLVNLDISKNLLSGSFPVELQNLKNLQQMVIADNVLEGPLPGSLFSVLRKLQVVVLSGNKLDGTVPSASQSPSNLRVVDVSRNNFTGGLPTFSSIESGLETALNLSNNAFYGNLTSLFGNFSIVDVSGNYIQGKVPVGNSSNVRLNQNCLQDVPDQRTLAECRLFYSERALTFEDTELKQESGSSKNSKRWLYILVGVLGGIGFVAVLVFVIVLVIRSFDMSFANQRGSSNVGPVPEGDSPSSVAKEPVVAPSLGRSFTYEQVIQLTGEFSESNLIKQGHSGDIFRGYMGGTSVAVKRVHARTERKESYLMELELLSKHPHERLVPLVGHCMKNENEKFLVYKYMPNGDLANSLYKETNLEDDSLQSLDWITRLKIATGAAEGLSYLHRCSPPLVHRDVQASSILLDDKFEVRLGSLSEIHVQEGDVHQSVFTRFLRKPQSSDPGPSARTSSICAYDVYCFGKVLLELVTGRLGISSSDDATTREWLEQTMACIDMYDKELVTKIVDPSLIIDEDLLEEVWAMAIIARSCLNAKPAKRPPMKYVLKALENPLKIVREESHSSGRLRTTSSRRSWSAAFFGSLRHSSSEYAGVPCNNNREVISSSSKQPVRVGSQGSGRMERSSSQVASNENQEECDKLA